MGVTPGSVWGVTPVPPVPISRGRTVMKAEYAGGVLILKKEECCWPVCRSQVQVRNVLMDSKIKQGRLQGRQVLANACSSSCFRSARLTYADVC
jgi:hypothetical protein